jgi:hypothetical protein
MSGKGSRPRPYSVDLNTFDNNWDKIFGKKSKPEDVKTEKKSKLSKGDKDASKSGRRQK